MQELEREASHGGASRGSLATSTTNLEQKIALASTPRGGKGDSASQPNEAELEVGKGMGRSGSYKIGSMTRETIQTGKATPMKENPWIKANARAKPANAPVKETNESVSEGEGGHDSIASAASHTTGSGVTPPLRPPRAESNTPLMKFGTNSKDNRGAQQAPSTAGKKGTPDASEGVCRSPSLARNAPDRMVGGGSSPGASPGEEPRGMSPCGMPTIDGLQDNDSSLGCSPSFSESPPVQKMPLSLPPPFVAERPSVHRPGPVVSGDNPAPWREGVGRGGGDAVEGLHSGVTLPEWTSPIAAIPAKEEREKNLPRLSENSHRGDQMNLQPPTPTKTPSSMTLVQGPSGGFVPSSPFLPDLQTRSQTSTPKVS